MTAERVAIAEVVRGSGAQGVAKLRSLSLLFGLSHNLFHQWRMKGTVRGEARADGREWARKEEPFRSLQETRAASGSPKRTLRNEARSQRFKRVANKRLTEDQCLRARQYLSNRLRPKTKSTSKLSISIEFIFRFDGPPEKSS